MSLLTGLQGYWKFDESSGNASDSSGNSNTLTNTGGATYVAAKINNGASFTGSEYFTITNGSQTGLNITSALSVSFWVNLASQPTGSDFEFVTKWASGNGAYRIIYQDNSGTFQLVAQLYDSGSPSSNIGFRKNQTLSNSTWYHLVYTYNTSGNVMEAFVNGSSIGTTTGEGTVSTINSSSGNFSIGDLGIAIQGFVNGKMDEVGIWSRVLTSGEVTTLYNSGNGLSYPFTASALSSNFFALL